jgi:WD40 repeat protein
MSITIENYFDMTFVTIPNETSLNTPSGSFLLSGHTGPIDKCNFSPDSMLFASCSNEVIFWRTSDLDSIGSFKNHKFLITTMSFSKDSSKILTGSADSLLVFKIAGHQMSLKSFAILRKL